MLDTLALVSDAPMDTSLKARYHAIMAALYQTLPTARNAMKITSLARVGHAHDVRARLPIKLAMTTQLICRVGALVSCRRVKMAS
jgi:hypothetical protein